MRSWLPRPLLVLLIATLVPSIFAVGPWKHDPYNRQSCSWNYADPNTWGDICPEYSTCKTGTFQSPINLKLDTVTQTTELSSLDFSNYKDFEPIILNNGHTIELEDQAQLSMNFGGSNYILRQLHFHSPSEHHIEDRTFPLEVHFVHTNNQSQYLVIAVLFQDNASNEPNPFLAKFWSYLPSNISKEKIDGLTVNPTELFSTLQNKNYYHTIGSLTTPPCTEAINWIIMESQSTVSKDQLHTFGIALEISNSRPVQPLGTRSVHLFQEKEEGFFSNKLAVAAAFAGFAGVVAVIVTLLVEKFGGLIGGALGASPSTIIPVSIGIVFEATNDFDIQVALFTVAIGMFMNSGYLFLWKVLPSKYPANLRNYAKLAFTLIIALAAWAAVAASLVAFTTFVVFTLPKSTALYFMLGMAALSVALHLAFGALLAVYGDHPVSKVKAGPSKLMIVFRALFTFGVSMGAIYLASYSGIVAGMAAIFPAIFTTTMVSLWISHGIPVVQNTASSMMLGGLSVSVYALLFAALRPVITLIPAVVVAYAGAVLSTTVPTVQILRKVLQSRSVVSDSSNEGGLELEDWHSTDNQLEQE